MHWPAPLSRIGRPAPRLKLATIHSGSPGLGYGYGPAGTTPTTLNLPSFLSPTRNIFCDIREDDRAYCASRNRPHVASMNVDGVLRICNGLRCLGPNPAEPFTGSTAPVLRYGAQDVFGLYRCKSAMIGITCTVNHPGKSYGKGFLINRSGISRVG